MTLGVSNKFIWPDIANIPFVNIAGCDFAGGNQVAQPLGGVWVPC